MQVLVAPLSVVGWRTVGAPAVGPSSSGGGRQRRGDFRQAAGGYLHAGGLPSRWLRHPSGAAAGALPPQAGHKAGDGCCRQTGLHKALLSLPVALPLLLSG
jgi:hypothetical protein